MESNGEFAHDHLYCMHEISCIWLNRKLKPKEHKAAQQQSALTSCLQAFPFPTGWPDRDAVMTLGPQQPIKGTFENQDWHFLHTSIFLEVFYYLEEKTNNI